MSSIINANNTLNYYITPTGISISGRIKSYENIAERDDETNPPEYAIVVDATADPTVNSGTAMYAYRDDRWIKVYETESMDLDDKFNWDNIIGKPDISKEEYDVFIDKIKEIEESLDLTGSTLKFKDAPVFDATRDIKVSGTGLTVDYSNNTVSIHADRTVQNIDDISTTIYQTSKDFMDAIIAKNYPLDTILIGSIKTMDLPEQIAKADIHISVICDNDKVIYNAFIYSTELSGLYLTKYDATMTVVEWVSISSSNSGNGTWVVL